MRAQRDEDEFERLPARKPQERRLAYEIALGIIIGGTVLHVMDLLSAALITNVMMQQVKLTLPF